MFYNLRLLVHYKLFDIHGFFPVAFGIPCLRCFLERGNKTLVTYVCFFGKRFTLCINWEINPKKLKSLAYLTLFLADLFKYFFFP